MDVNIVGKSKNAALRTLASRFIVKYLLARASDQGFPASLVINNRANRNIDPWKYALFKRDTENEGKAHIIFNHSVVACRLSIFNEAGRKRLEEACNAHEQDSNIVHMTRHLLGIALIMILLIRDAAWRARPEVRLAAKLSFSAQNPTLR